MSYLSIVEEQLKRHEGVKLKPYKDSVGLLTIGIGRNLDGVGLRPDEVALMFANDVMEADRVARKLVRNFDQLSNNRKAVILNLAFNMGETTLSKFVNTLKAMNDGRWEDAAKGLEQSLWYKQVGGRAKELVSLWRKG